MPYASYPHQQDEVKNPGRGGFLLFQPLMSEYEANTYSFDVPYYRSSLSLLIFPFT